METPSEAQRKLEALAVAPGGEPRLTHAEERGAEVLEDDRPNVAVVETVRDNSVSSRILLARRHSL